MRKIIPVLTLLAILLAGCAQTLEHAIWSSPSGTAGYIPPGSAESVLERKLELLQAHIERVLGVSIHFAFMQDDEHATSEFGTSYLEQRHIIIGAQLGTQARIEVMLHEAAHIIMPEWLTYSEAEMFADAVSLDVCRRFGIDTKATTAQYLAKHKHATYILQAYANEIAWAAAVLSGVVE